MEKERHPPATQQEGLSTSASLEGNMSDRGRRLEEVAKRESKGNPLLEEVLLKHLHYEWGKDTNGGVPQIDKPTDVDGVKFWRVGHNASHEFYVGIDGNGKRFVRAIGEGVCENEDDIPELKESITEVTGSEGWGYVGHL